MARAKRKRITPRAPARSCIGQTGNRSTKWAGMDAASAPPVATFSFRRGVPWEWDQESAFGNPAAYGFDQLPGQSLFQVPFAFDPTNLILLLIFIMVVASLANIGLVWGTSRLEIPRPCATKRRCRSNRTKNRDEPLQSK